MQAATRFPNPIQRAWCSVMGHRIDHLGERASHRAHPACLCGGRILRNGTTTHIGHVFACARHGHELRLVRQRAGLDEFVCDRCAHPMLLASPRAKTRMRRKPIDWVCGIRGHRVMAIGRWRGYVEQACGCGHPFLLEARTEVVRHPAQCVLVGHSVKRLGRRGRHDVFRCERCGHPFYFETLRGKD